MRTALVGVVLLALAAVAAGVLWVASGTQTGAGSAPAAVAPVVLARQSRTLRATPDGIEIGGV